MVGQKIVVIMANQLRLNGFEYKQWALMVKNLIDFLIAISFLLPQFLDLAVGLLQLLQPEPHTTNTGFIRSHTGKFSLEDISKTPELWQSVGSVG